MKYTQCLPMPHNNLHMQRGCTRRILQVVAQIACALVLGDGKHAFHQLFCI